MGGRLGVAFGHKPELFGRPVGAASCGTIRLGVSSASAELRGRRSASWCRCLLKSGIDTRQVVPLIYLAALNERLQSRRTWFGMTGW